MGSQCSCFKGSSDSNITFDTSLVKILPKASLEHSTRYTTKQAVPDEVEEDSLESLQFSEEEEWGNIDSSVLNLNSYKDTDIELVMKAFSGHIEHLMQTVMGHKELLVRKQSQAALAIDEMQPLAEFDRMKVESIQPVFIKGGSLYQGEVSPCGEVRGYGLAYNSDGSVYEGAWKRDKYNGYGRLVLGKEYMYEGDFVEGMFHGTGTCKMLGFLRRGEWVGGLAHGSGYEVHTDLYTYQGNYDNGAKSGKGTLEFKDGGAYVGEFKQNVFDGFGVRTWADKTYYGSWVEGRMQGTGTLSLKSGDKYKGEFLNDMKHGKGVYYFDNGSDFEGTWFTDEIQGEGVLRHVKGDKTVGQWKSAELKELACS
jgi:hypothetical protein